jgi:nucleotide-binding universal stress UspA family protein
MYKLLVPIDSSETATRALQHAILLAKRDPTIELQIVNAHEPPVVYGEIAVYLPEE